MRSRRNPARLVEMTTNPVPCSPSRTVSDDVRRHGSRLVGAVAALTIGLLGACGGSDDEATADSATESETESAPESAADNAATEAGAASESGDDGGGTDVPPVDDVAACLDDAGYTMVANEDMLSEQQRADLETAFGQVDGLTFDASTTGFAGGIQFFADEDQVAQRADRLADVALELRPVGTALISVEAGSNYDDAVAAAETCLS